MKYKNTLIATLLAIFVILPLCLLILVGVSNVTMDLDALNFEHLIIWVYLNILILTLIVCTGVLLDKMDRKKNRK